MLRTLLKRVEEMVKESPFLYCLVRKNYYLLVHLFRFPHEPEFAILKKLAGRKGDLIDIGANDGLSAYSMRVFDRTNRIVCLEPDACHEKALKRAANRLGNLDCRICAAGERPGRMTLFTPIYRGLAITPCASLVEAEARDLPKQTLFTRTFDPAHLEILRKEIEVVPVDELALKPYFVKIDVQGGEMTVLRGMAKTIREHRPVVMIEKGDFFSDVHEHLTALEYVVVDPESGETIRIEDTEGQFNIVFWPAELNQAASS